MLFALASLLQGCSHFSFEKRRYREGFYFSHSGIKDDQVLVAGNKNTGYKPFRDQLIVSNAGVPEISSNTVTTFSPGDKNETKNISPVLQSSPHVSDRTKVRQRLHNFLYRSDGGETHIGFMALLALLLAVIFFFVSGMAVGVWMGVWLVTAGLSFLMSIIYAFFSRNHSDTESDASLLVAKIMLALFVVGILAWLAIANA